MGKVTNKITIYALFAIKIAGTAAKMRKCNLYIAYFRGNACGNSKNSLSLQKVIQNILKL